MKGNYLPLQALMREAEFAQAFTEFAWARHLERNSLKRRWPYRDPWADTNQRWGANLRVLGEPESHIRRDVADGLWMWLEYHWAEYWMRCIWAHEKASTRRFSPLGVPAVFGMYAAPTDWDWAAKVQPDGSASFACVHVATSFFPAQCHKTKKERLQEKLMLDAQRSQAMLAACSGPCLTWNAVGGWQVTSAITPPGLHLKRRTLRRAHSGRPKFWLYPTGGNFAARLEAIPLQVIEPTPKQAISVLRTAYVQYAMTFPTAGPPSR